ncbi:hypothetical protein LSAT2_026423 [Lamellibrachia satsuma]|nr:hypothetical protein LSAT2_026423 [Lamellibrachia satsuma]
MAEDCLNVDVFLHSGASLKLLVVPKDEDVLQMAYHSSAYNHGKHPYKGSATDIPSPPGLHPSDLPQGKPPVAPRFKTELQLSAGSVGGANVSTASENATWGADTRVPCCQVTGGSSAALPMDATFRHMGKVQYLPTDGATRHNICVSSAPPLVPIRTCSKNITLANLHGASHPRGGSTSSDGSVKSSHAVMCPHSHGDMRSASHENLPRHYGSHERLLRTSNENICVGGRTGSRPSHLSHSSDDLLSRVSKGSTAAAVLAQRKARTIGPVNCGQSMANRNAVPYTRSHTTLSLVTAPTSTSAGMVAARDAYNHNLQGAPWCHSNYYYTPRAVSGTEPRMPLTSNGGYYSCRDTEQMCWSGSEAPPATYGIAVSFPISTDNACNVAELPKSYSTDFEAGHSQHAHEGSASRYSMPATNDRNQAINLVTERMKKFESMDSVDSNSSVGSATSGNGRYHSDAPKMPSRRFGCDSVATRAAQYEHLMSDDDEYMQREQSPVARQQLSGSLSHLQQNPSDTNRSGNVAPATINIYFRSESPQHPIMQLDRSPHRPRAASHSPHPANRRSPRLQLQIQRPTSESSHRFAMRQPSYLSAIHSPKELKQEPSMLGSDVTMTTNTPSMAGGSVILRSQTAQDDKETKLSRRTSYLMATRQTVSLPVSAMSEDKSSSSNMTQPSSTQPPMAVSTSVSTTVSAPSPLTSPTPLTTCSKLELQLCTSTLAAMAVVTTATTADDDNNKVVTTTSSPVPPIPRPPTPQSPMAMEPAETTPTKTSNIRKLKAFFGEKTPRIEAATSDQKSLQVNEVTMEGVLNCKVAVVEGKRASDRSWRPVWALLKNYQLILYKEVTISGGASTTYEEQPIGVRQCLVDVATEYAKKKRNVFRLTTLGGCEYLFQTDDHDIMLQWIRAIQQNTGGADNMVATAAQKMAAAAVAGVTGVTGVSQPQSEQVMKSSPGIKSKKLSSRSLKAKSIGAVSPAFRPKKTWLEKDHSSDLTKPKDNKTWKGRVAKKFKRYGSSSAASSVDTGSSTEVTGTFGVPLEQCPPSNFFEFVPLVVELCIDIVEAKGLENQGIYRVPGNTGAVNMLQELLNNATGVEDLDMENEKWSDVNVVSSLLKTFFRKLPDPLVTEDDFLLPQTRPYMTTLSRDFLRPQTHPYMTTLSLDFLLPQTHPYMTTLSRDFLLPQTHPYMTTLSRDFLQPQTHPYMTTLSLDFLQPQTHPYMTTLSRDFLLPQTHPYMTTLSRDFLQPQTHPYMTTLSRDFLQPQTHPYMTTLSRDFLLPQTHPYMTTLSRDFLQPQTHPYMTTLNRDFLLPQTHPYMTTLSRDFLLPQAHPYMATVSRDFLQPQTHPYMTTLSRDFLLPQAHPYMTTVSRDFLLPQTHPYMATLSRDFLQPQTHPYMTTLSLDFLQPQTHPYMTTLSLDFLLPQTHPYMTTLSLDFLQPQTHPYMATLSRDFLQPQTHPYMATLSRDFLQPQTHPYMATPSLDFLQPQTHPYMTTLSLDFLLPQTHPYMATLSRDFLQPQTHPYMTTLSLDFLQPQTHPYMATVSRDFLQPQTHPYMTTLSRDFLQPQTHPYMTTLILDFLLPQTHPHMTTLSLDFLQPQTHPYMTTLSRDFLQPQTHPYMATLSRDFLLPQTHPYMATLSLDFLLPQTHPYMTTLSRDFLQPQTHPYMTTLSRDFLQPQTHPYMTTLSRDFLQPQTHPYMATLSRDFLQPQTHPYMTTLSRDFLQPQTHPYMTTLSRDFLQPQTHPYMTTLSRDFLQPQTHPYMTTLSRDFLQPQTHPYMTTLSRDFLQPQTHPYIATLSRDFLQPQTHPYMTTLSRDFLQPQTHPYIATLSRDFLLPQTHPYMATLSRDFLQPQTHPYMTTLSRVHL